MEKTFRGSVSPSTLLDELVKRRVSREHFKCFDFEQYKITHQLKPSHGDTDSKLYHIFKYVDPSLLTDDFTAKSIKNKKAESMYHEVVATLETYIDYTLTEDNFHETYRTDLIKGCTDVSTKKAISLSKSLVAYRQIADKRNNILRYIHKLTLLIDTLPVDVVEHLQEVSGRVLVQMKHAISRDIGKIGSLDHTTWQNLILHRGNAPMLGVKAMRDILAKTDRHSHVRKFNDLFIGTLPDTISTVTVESLSHISFVFKEMYRRLQVRNVAVGNFRDYYSTQRPLDINYRIYYNKFLDIVNRLANSIHKYHNLRLLMENSSYDLLDDMIIPHHFKFIAASELLSHKLFIESRMDIDYIGKSFECDPVTLYFTILIAAKLVISDVDKLQEVTEFFTALINRLIPKHDINTDEYLESTKLQTVIYNKLGVHILHSMVVKIPLCAGREHTEIEFDKVIVNVYLDRVIDVIAVIELKLNIREIDVGLSRKQEFFRLLTSDELFDEHPLIKISANNGSSEFFIDRNSFKRFHTSCVRIGPAPFREHNLVIEPIYFITKCRKVANVEMQAYSKYIGNPINCKYRMISTAIHRNIMPELYKQWWKDYRNPLHESTYDLLTQVYANKYRQNLYVLNRSLVPY
jgi:hypothetical protein